MRLKFVEATEGRKHTAAAHQMVARIRQFYVVERDCRNLTPEERKIERERRSK